MPADVVARGVERLPGRLRRRLDDAVTRAGSWPVATHSDTVEVRPDESTTVTVRVPVRGDDDVVCSCLLAPACLHRAAVLSLAPVAESVGSPGATVSTVELDGPTDRERAAAESVWWAGCDLLAGGIAGAGAVHQAVLLRAAHEARAVGLPRLGSAALRVVARLRSARSDQPEFRLGQLVGDLRELLRVAYGLRTGHGDAELLRGTARRDYRGVGNLRLYGLLCETIATASGYGGAVTYLVDESGRLWQLGSVTPGGTGLAAGRPDALVSIGEARLSYRELSHGGLRVVNASASADGRLGSGKATTAVAAPGVGWDEPPLAGRWRPLADQLADYRAALDRPGPNRPCGYDLMFLAGTVDGLTGSGLALDVDGTGITVVAPTDAPGLPYVDNLTNLAGSVGRPVRLIGRYAGPAVVAGLAVAADWLESELPGSTHVDLGVDRLRRTAAAPTDQPDPDATPARDTVAPDQPAPLYLLARRLERCVEGGRIAAPGRPSDIPALRSAQLHTAAQLAQRLDDEAARVSRDHFGRIAPAANEPLALAWLAAAIFLEAATRAT